MADIRILVFFEKLLNSLLDRDSQKQFLLRQLQCQVLCVELYDLNYTCYFVPDDHKITITQRTAGSDVHKLSGSSGMLIAMLISAWPAEFIQKKQIRFAGDIKVLKQYSVFFKAIRPDLFIHLRHKNPDNPLINVIDKALSLLRDGIKRRMQILPINISAYLQEEREIFPCQEEIEDFFDDIALLKQDCDRIEKKLGQLSKARLADAEN